MKKQHILGSILFCLLGSFISAQDIPRIEPLTLYAELAEISGDLTEEQFIEAAFVASGNSQFQRSGTELFSLIREIKEDLATNLDQYGKGEEILKALHDKLFRRYDEDQTKIDVVFDTGQYNCVSSAVIYMAAGRYAGLNVQGVRTVDHAFVSVLIDDEIVDVETTNIWGFDPGQKKEFTDSFSGSTGYNYVPPGNYRLRQSISDKDMIGLILQNRIAGLQRRGDHESAVPLAIDRFVLTNSPEAQKDMYDSFSNYASQLNSRRSYETGIEFLTSVITSWGESPKVTSALEAIVHNRLLSMIENDQSEEAEEFLQIIVERGYISSEAANTDRAMIYDKRTVDLLNSSEPFEPLQDYLDRIYEEGYLARSKWIEYTQYNYIREAEIIAAGEGWLDAYLFVKRAPQEITGGQKYRQLLQNCRNNYIVTVHNAFADLYNRGSYSDAEELLLQGLENIPDDRTLLSDLELVRKKTSP